ncbi:MAG: RHS repeat-associated core domain-containing protein [Candidatus Schekmanbacteria bacterium]|nr:RHS repeat-associated core domain-containing protein [Candidatus Schekmanbacteria bacterium]
MEYDYDADGNRVSARLAPPGEPVTEAQCLVDAAGGLSHVVAALAAASNPTAHYARAADELLAVIREREIRYLHVEALGSVPAPISAAGAAIDGYPHSAFGEMLPHQGGDAQPYGFTGEPADRDTALAYHCARWLDADTGRFVSADPLLATPGAAIMLDGYAYAGNEPVTSVDPTGFLTDSQLGAKIHKHISFPPAPLTLAG